MIISVGHSRKSTSWLRTNIFWSDFVDKLRTPIRTAESYEEFMKSPSNVQGNLKDVGGFVGGALIGARRRNGAVDSRDLITLDFDNIPPGQANFIIQKVASLGCASVIYSTRKHCSAAPRLRIIFPSDRSMTADEYEPCARKMAELIAIECADPTTFEVTRLMYWPSCSRDSEYIFEYVDAAFVNVEGLLNSYGDWRDVDQWPQVPGKELSLKRLATKQQDPLEKSGIVGAFCKTYSIEEAIEKYIPLAYDRTDVTDRLTYTGGATSAGAIIYDGGKFLYSHHATDPVGGKLVNAWDLVRLHKFSDLDDEAKDGTPAIRMPSFLKMIELVKNDNNVVSKLDAERIAKASDIFSDLEDSENLDWLQRLEREGKDQKIAKTIDNIVIILENDTGLKEKIVFDEFENKAKTRGGLPWNSSLELRDWTDVDSAQVQRYFELVYKIPNPTKIEQGLLIVGNNNGVNSVKEYLDSLSWDGQKRVETLLHDYLGAEDNAYTRAVMRKILVAAIKRATEGATKFDNMPILVGSQGIGKSTFLSILGRNWFTDSLQSFEGKDAAEIIQGQWIVEVGELTALNKSETEAIKQFLSKKDDVYRQAYGKHATRFPRRCVFFGTSNKDEFLRDWTGSRRFWPIECGIYEPKKNIFTDLENEVGQIWAEAIFMKIIGEPLFLNKEESKLASLVQEQYKESNSKEGIIRDYIDSKIPANWETLTLSQRRQFLNGNLKNTEPLVERTKICALEVWCEALGGDPRYMQRKDATEINNILSSFEGWKRNKKTMRCGYCGPQKGFEKLSI